MTADGTTATTTAGPLGILAGGGQLPERIAELTLARGRGVHIVALEGEASRGIERFPHTWVNWGGIGRMTRSFRAAGCRDMIFVGGVKRPDPRRVRPDLGLIRAIPTIIRLFGGGDDHVLRRVVRFFESQGFTVRGVADVAPELLVQAGTLGRIAPAPAYMRDGACGFALIDALGAADVGQAVVIRDGGVLGVEAAEGTDRMLARLAESGDRRAAGGILVKAPKPGQELRIDMPAIGPRTVELAATAGLAGIAVEAGRVLVADRTALIEAADAAGLFVTGLEHRPASVAERRIVAMTALGRVVPETAVRRDVARGAGVLAAVAGYGRPAGVVVVRRHVIAVETGEGLAAMMARLKALRQWGATDRSRRRGALVVSQDGIAAAGLEEAIALAADCGLAGIAVMPGMSSGAIAGAGRSADEHRVSLVEVHDQWCGAVR